MGNGTLRSIPPTLLLLHHIHYDSPITICFSSVQFSGSVMSNSLWLHGLQHTGLFVHHQLPKFAQIHVYRVSDAIQPSNPLSSPSPPTSNLSILAALGSFLMNQFFTSDGQSIGVSASASVLPKNILGCFPLEWTGLTSFQSKALLRVFSNITVRKHQFFSAPLSL